MVNWKRLFYGKSGKKIENEHDKIVEEAKKSRKDAEDKINGMIAQLDGCGDRWFLKPLEPIDECTSEDLNGE